MNTVVNNLYLPAYASYFDHIKIQTNTITIYKIIDTIRNCAMTVAN